MLVRPHDRAIHVVLLPIQVTLRVRLPLDFGQDAHPQPTALPAIEARGDCLPGAVACGEVAPRCSRLGNPEHAIDIASVVVEWMPTLSRVAQWQQRGEPFPLLIR
jgi:hypothetical protein